MDARGIQARVRRIIEISFEEPALKERLIHGLDLLERELSEPIERRKVHLKKSQLVILKKIVVALGKKSEEVDKYITQQINENRVKTNENGEITVIDLSMSQFSGSIPQEIGELTALTVLNLNSNQLSGSIPPEIGQLKALTELWLSDNKELGGALPVLPSGCTVDVSGTHISTVAVKIKPLKTSLDYFMIIQYVILGYADLVTDILVIIELINSDRIGMAVINLFFIVLGVVLGYWNSDRTAWDLVLNVTQLSIFVDGIETLKQGKQTQVWY